MHAENTQSDTNTSHCRKEKCDFLSLIGRNGQWQWRVFLLTLFTFIPGATHNLVMSFLAPNIDHWYARPHELLNVSVQQWKSMGLPPDNQKCYKYDNMDFTDLLEGSKNESYKIVPCDAWEYDESVYSSSVVSQWDLVCNREWLVSFSKSIFIVGIFLSNIIFGYLADKFGRRPIVAIAAVTAVCFSTICSFSTSIAMFIVTRCFVSLGISGCHNIMFVLMLEVVDPQWRSIYGVATNFGWSIGYLSLPGIAWLLRDWFWIQVTITAPCFILLGMWRVVPESPRWLLSQGRVDEAHNVMKQAAAVNGVKLSDTDIALKKLLTEASEYHESGEGNSNVLDLIRTPGLRQITVIICFAWFTGVFVYYGMTYNTNDLAGDPFINFTISGAIEIPSFILCIFVIRSLGRKTPLILTMMIGGSAYFFTHILPADPWWLSVAASMVGKFCMSTAFSILYVYTGELFPTVLRNTGFGYASMCGRIASCVSPFVRELGNATHPIVPCVIFGGLTVISGGLVILLPETSSCIVPDSVKEAASRNESTKCCTRKESPRFVAVTASKTDENILQEETTFSVPVTEDNSNNEMGRTSNNR